MGPFCNGNLAMTRRLFRILAALGLAAGLSGFALPAHAEKRVALMQGPFPIRFDPEAALIR